MFSVADGFNVYLHTTSEEDIADQVWRVIRQVVVFS